MAVSPAVWFPLAPVGFHRISTCSRPLPRHDDEIPAQLARLQSIADKLGQGDVEFQLHEALNGESSPILEVYVSEDCPKGMIYFLSGDIAKNLKLKRYTSAISGVKANPEFCGVIRDISVDEEQQG